MPANHTPGVREDRNGQFVPTIDGVDTSPTSFDKGRALDIARQVCALEDLEDKIRATECKGATIHAPTEWTWREMDNDKMIPSIRIFTKSKSGKDMCIGRLDTKEYAERACHAVNCHEELVGALELAAKLCCTARQHFPKSMHNSDRFQLENTCAAIGKVLARAKGQP